MLLPRSATLALLAVILWHAIGSHRVGEGVAPAPDEPMVLEGRVTDGAGRGVPGVRLTLYSGLATRFQGQSVLTDENGRYRFSPLETYQSLGADDARRRAMVGVRVEHESFVRPSGDDWFDVHFDVAPGHVERHDFTMEPGAKLSGRVLTSRGDHPVGNLSIIVERADSSARRYATTDHRGRFRTTALAAGEYVVKWNFPAADYAELCRFRVEPGLAHDLTVRLSLAVTATHDVARTRDAK